jgi:hypothetical protein
MAKDKAGSVSKKGDSAGAKKRGTPSDFRGARLAMMIERLPEYIALSKSKKPGKKKDTGAFWATFFHDYWRAFPWRLPLEQEPPPSPEQPPATAEDAFKALDLDLSEEEQSEKTRIQSQTKLVRFEFFFGGGRSSNWAVFFVEGQAMVQSPATRRYGNTGKSLFRISGFNAPARSRATAKTTVGPSVLYATQGLQGRSGHAVRGGVQLRAENASFGVALQNCA